ncbi:MAG: hypothetical protein IPM29_00175 [Planctomycetes bacterium]|nr:hypothetical protein [Planctomycetota bacterium]
MSDLRPLRGAPLLRGAALLLSLLGACSSTPDREPRVDGPSAAESLRDAEDALAIGDLAAADRALLAARRAEPRADARDLALLEAAVDIERDRLDEAGARLRSYPDDRAAEELRGRIDLRRGAFDRAQDRFRELAATAGTHREAVRLMDLATLAAGLVAYSEGRYVDALDTWQTIEDQRLQGSLSQVLAELAVDAPARGADRARLAGGAR